MKILGIETSCDETAAAVVENGVKILSNVVVSQIDIFAEYGGVIPEVAARSHLEVILPVIDKALSDAKCSWDDIDAIAVTHAPGLLGSLLIGTLTARTLAILHNKPLYAVHHLKSHVYANWLNIDDDIHTCSRVAFDRPVVTSDQRLPSPCQASDSLETSMHHCPSFPILALVVSGGHTQILYMPTHNQFEIVGTTQDDAVGECFDKVAKILGLPYPGGPAITKVAMKGNASKYKLPHPKVQGLDFSFSGLKTAVLRAIQKETKVPISYPSYKLKELLTPKQVADFAASFQKTAVDILREKMELALKQYPNIHALVVAGGVSANALLREEMKKAFLKELEDWQREDKHLGSVATKIKDKVQTKSLPVFFPAIQFSGDNGAMVGAACYFEIQSGVKPTDPYALNIYPRISIEN